ncbi:MAG: hypothetical protein ACREFP_14620 [Acetobacteraceae bacterium]
MTIIEIGPRLVPREDEDASETIAGFPAKEDVTVRLNAKCLHVRKQGDDIILTIDCGGLRRSAARTSWSRRGGGPTRMISAWSAPA